MCPLLIHLLATLHVSHFRFDLFFPFHAIPMSQLRRRNTANTKIERFIFTSNAYYCDLYLLLRLESSDFSEAGLSARCSSSLCESGPISSSLLNSSSSLGTSGNFPLGIRCNQRYQSQFVKLSNCNSHHRYHSLIPNRRRTRWPVSLAVASLRSTRNHRSPLSFPGSHLVAAEEAALRPNWTHLPIRCLRDSPRFRGPTTEMRVTTARGAATYYLSFFITKSFRHGK